MNKSFSHVSRVNMNTNASSSISRTPVDSAYDTRNVFGSPSEHAGNDHSLGGKYTLNSRRPPTPSHLQNMPSSTTSRMRYSASTSYLARGMRRKKSGNNDRTKTESFKQLS